MVTETERIAILLQLENEAFEKKAKSSARAINKLEARYDPLAKAAKRFEIEQTQINRALDAGTIDAAKHAKLLAKMRAEHQRVVAKIKGTKSQIVGMNGAVASQNVLLHRNQSMLAASSARVGSFGKAMVGGLAGGLVTTALAGVTSNLNDVVKGIASVGDEAKRSGLDVKYFQEWKFVAEQNRIGIDQLVDGFKELNLRADEFAITGKGPAADAFKRIGLSGKDLQRKLKDPSNLMLEIVGRMEELDKAAQIRVADEIFGGSAGERFVELLSQGEEGLRRTVSRAYEVGAVMDSEMIAKADELDRKFQDVATRAGMIGKKLAVGLADGLAGILSAKNDLDGIFGDAERAGAVLGPDISEELAGNKDAIAEHAEDLRQLHATYDELFGLINQMTGPDGVRVFEIDNEGAKYAISDILTGLKEAVDQLEAGQIEANEFEGEISALVGEAQDVADELAAIDDVAFANVISAIGGIGSALQVAIKKAKELKISLPGKYTSSGRGDGASEVQRRRNEGNTAPTDLAPLSSPRPRSAPSLLGEPDLNPPAGGGSSRGDDYQKQVDRLRERTAMLDAEAAALIAASVAGQEYGGALEYARKRAELMHAAQSAGKKLTPELQAEIDALAKSYVAAGDAVESASDKLSRMEGAAERGSDALSDIFLDVADGSKTAKEAVASLLREIIRIQLQKGFGRSVAGGGMLGSVSSFLGGLLSFDGGGGTGNGSRSGGLDGKGGFLAMMHPQETVTDHTKSEYSPELVKFPRAAQVHGTKQAVQPMTGSGVAQIDCRVYIDQGGNWRGEVERISGVQARVQIEQATPNLIGKSMQAVRESSADTKNGAVSF